MELEIALKVGLLYVPPQNFLRKTWVKKYCALYAKSKHGIQRLELFETEDNFMKQIPSKIVPLTECWKVTPLPQKNQANVFEVRTKSSTYQYSAETFQEMSDWIANLQIAAFSKYESRSYSTAALTSDEKQEENLLYCSMDEPEVYAVKAVATEAVLRNNLQGDYKLIITRVNFSLSNESSQGRIGKVILTWPYRHIRRYGCSPETFSFEAGRKCSSGEGLFTFTTNDGSRIFQSIDSHVSALKSTQGEGGIPNSPSIKEDKNNCFTSKDSLKFDELFSSQNINKSDQSFTFDNNSEASMSLKSSFKPSPPIKKPPRKSRSGLYEQGSENNSGVNKMTFEDSPNQYAEICGINSYETFIKCPEKASNNLKHSSELSDVPPSIIGNVKKTSGGPDPEDLSSCMEDLKLAETKKKDTIVKQTSSNLDYENCFSNFKTVPQSSRSTSAAEHVYGKLSNTKPSKPTEYLYGSIITHPNAGADGSPIYSNVPFVKQPPSKSTGEIDNEPDHFLKNDAEYAQVFKKNSK